MTGGAVELVGEGASITLRVPQDAAEDAIWKSVGFDDSSWATGALGIGFDIGPSFAPFINTDVSAEMRGINASSYLRVAFQAPRATFTSLVLRMRSDDGFVAYLNGVEIARDRAPPMPVFNSSAVASHPDVFASTLTDFDVSGFIGALNIGAENVLAIHGMNASIGSSDYLIDARLEGQAIPVTPPLNRPLEIDSVLRDTAGIHLTLPSEFACRRIGVEYSAEGDEGSWLQLGNFSDDPTGVPRFSDPDTIRTGRAKGFYRAFLRPEP